MIIIGVDINDILVLKIELARQLEMKDLRSLWYFLDIEVAYSSRGYLLSQLKYVANILEWVKLTDNKTVDTPIEVNIKYSSSDVLLLSNPTIIGSLIYFTITCLDIAYIVHVSQFVTSPTTIHWAVVLCILWYL